MSQAPAQVSIPAVVYLTDDRKAQAYVARRQRDLPALQAEFQFGTQSETQIDLGYTTITKTATGWLVGNLSAVGLVAVQAYILARFW
jgi:hypothetical protein